MTPLEELATILRPAGGGLYLVSTGKAAQLELQRKLYGVSSEAEVHERFVAALDGIARARGVLLAVPSDVGAGFERGANTGPQAIRLQLLADDSAWLEKTHELGLVDLGDVLVVPQLLHDSMLSATQLEQSRKAMYPNVATGERAELPVSPLSIAERAWDLVFAVNPSIKPFVFGGDHSTALPGVLALHRARPKSPAKPWGIVQSDAHTDLLAERLGVTYCFATWSWHANERLGRNGRLTQVGIRASGRDRAHWESTLGVRQFWAADVLQDPSRAMDDVIAHVRATCPGGVYFSNDIDGTDSKWADATGTPEPSGLEPDWLVELIRRLGTEVGLLGGDVMEVAPSLTRTPQSAPRTVALAARYFRETVNASLSAP